MCKSLCVSVFYFVLLCNGGFVWKMQIDFVITKFTSIKQSATRHVTCTLFA